jgi:hypothetical protein
VCGVRVMGWREWMVVGVLLVSGGRQSPGDGQLHRWGPTVVVATPSRDSSSSSSSSPPRHHDDSDTWVVIVSTSRFW